MTMPSEARFGNQNALKHGGWGTPEYRAWRSMKVRCLVPSVQSWKLYGGRGISICQEWIDSFQAFLSHVGPRPSPSHSLDRINNEGNYEPGNVRWATAREQALNRRSRPRHPEQRPANSRRAACHPDEWHWAKGLCHGCYNRAWKSRAVEEL